MKILALYSSPHQGQSNSSYLLDVIINEINRSGNHQILKCDLTKMNIGTCINCGVCRRPGNNSCFQKDDMQQIAAAISEADYIFMATPLYWWNISATLKSCIDRFYGIPFSQFAGKTFHLVMTGESDPSNIGYSLVEQSLTAVCGYIGARFKTFFAGASVNTIPAWNNDALIARAKEVGRSFN